MSWMRSLLSRVAALFGVRDGEDELDEELCSHVEMAAEENRRRGMSEEEARRAALRSFGGVTQVREDFRMREGVPWLENLSRDFSYALRQIKRSPGFAATVIGTLALGIGANAAVFSVLNAVLLRPLAFRDADRLVQILSVEQGQRVGPSALDIRDFAAANHTFEHMAVFDQWRKNVSTTGNGDNAEEVNVGLASSDFFEALGVQPILGRLFTDDEGLPGRNHVAVITRSFWNARFHSDPKILGRTLTINDERYTIVGVIPATIPGWLHTAQAQLPVFEPFLPTPDVWNDTSRGGRGNGAIGLMKPGVSIRQAQADLDSIARSLGAKYPVDRGVGVALVPLAEMRAGTLRPLLAMLMGAVSLILLITCANLAALLLARNTARARHFAMRRALGASGAALVRQVLAETLVFSFGGSGAGLALAWLVIRTLRAADPANLPQLLDLTLDWRVLAFTLASGVLTCVLCGIAPAILSARTDAGQVLKDGSRSSVGAARQAFRRTLVIAQIALSLMLVTAAALLLQTLARLEKQDLGFQVDHLMRAHFYLPPAQYATPESITAFCDRFSEKLRAIPGVREASVTTIYPPNDRWRMQFSIPGRPVTRLQDIPATIFGVVDARYLRAAGIPIVRGRDFAESDRERTPPVAIVNEAFVRRYFPGENPIGKRLELGAPASLLPSDPWLGSTRVQMAVAGVMRDNKDQGLALPAAPQLIALYRQLPIVNFGFKDILVRSDVPSATLTNSIEQQLHSLDPRIPLSEAESMGEYLDDMTDVQRFTGLLLSGFAGLGVMLAVIGIYGVMAYLVAQRTREIGVRLALGATRQSVLWLISQQGLWMGIWGVVAGVGGAVLAARTIQSLLYQISALDPLTLGAASVLLVVIALLAGLLPARRAADIDPMQALRTE